MQTRRQLLHRSVLLATVAAFSALWPSLARADEPPQTRQLSDDPGYVGLASRQPGDRPSISAKGMR
ncbi:hypothetical protein [Stutzerimonas stutzeri]|uniref:hypothetical protein n=1 Tax=Stutzerimonas stutzeri TaxID=316 RepID=UPI001C2EB268|nr:hypothetical protein [Stutzerimonas stutzeri]